MNYKTLLLVSLLTVPMIPCAFAQESNRSTPSIENPYGIRLDADYSGPVVLELLQMMEEEASEAISKAFEEGYKEGLLAEAPERVFWQTEAENLRADFFPKSWVGPTAIACFSLGVLSTLLAQNLGR